jgi:nucleoside-diphosphate-sugar epimerase
VKVVITGAAGFLGQRLARRLLARGQLNDRDGRAQRIEQLILADIVTTPDPGDPRVRVVTGDLGVPEVLYDIIDSQTDSVFHLAAVVSGQAEAEFDLGMRVNLDAWRALLDTCRHRGRAPKVVLTSSVAVYGGNLPQMVLDSTVVQPQSSYGTQKAICELLLNDYSRRGFVDGRALRLPTISIRPGKPNQAASSFASGILREPLNGEPATLPVSPLMRLWLSSPRQAIRSIIAGHELPASALGSSRIINLPGISVTVNEMLAALERVAGREVAERIRFTPDPTIEKIVASWPGAWDDSRAKALGLAADPDFDSIIRAYIEDDLPAAAAQ